MIDALNEKIFNKKSYEKITKKNLKNFQKITKKCWDISKYFFLSIFLFLYAEKLFLRISLLKSIYEYYFTKIEWIEGY